jgi:hypothetical protein
MLRYIASKGVAKWLPRRQALELYHGLRKAGWERDGAIVHKDTHSFSFAPQGNKVVVSYHRRELREFPASAELPPAEKPKAARQQKPRASKKEVGN